MSRRPSKVSRLTCFLLFWLTGMFLFIPFPLLIPMDGIGGGRGDGVVVVVLVAREQANATRGPEVTRKGERGKKVVIRVVKRGSKAMAVIVKHGVKGGDRLKL